MLDDDFVNTPEERKQLRELARLGVDITLPLEEQSKEAQAVYWNWVAEFAASKLLEIGPA